MANDKVFGSNITRSLNNLNNNLYDLLIIDPVKPLPRNTGNHLSCDFVPKTDKYFIPKRRLRLKVKTVRDIRNSWEKDINSTLAIDIEKQQQLLLRKISDGSSKDEKTKLLAKNMLQSDKPISRVTWQMLININPENYAHASQFVLWNGNHIQVNGSRGGRSKFISKYDLGERRASFLQRQEFKKSNCITKKDLLKQSLHVKFKPGPLSRKKQLDISYQKYNVGNIELAHLPKPGLDILPEYGKPIDTSVANFLHNLRDVNGIISEKWAEFAISALGTNKKGGAVQINKGCCINFDLSYKYDQRQLLMRCDVDVLDNKPIEKQIISTTCSENEDDIIHEVQKMLDDMLMSVEINLIQDTIYTGEDCPREHTPIDTISKIDCYPKDKVKRKGRSELHRLDVTVIRIFDTQEENKKVGCLKDFCRLGCICDSLLASYHIKDHCGRIECMFECKCNYNKYRNYFEEDMIPDLVSLDKEKFSKLSKEEQKFHQTVILSGEKSILLKSHKRNWKAPEKYAEFYSNMCLKTKKDIKQVLSVVETKLHYGNIEPWCMIHNLYKCFCKGKFTEKLTNTVSNDDIKAIESESNISRLPQLKNLHEGENKSSCESNSKPSLRPRTSRSPTIKENTDQKSFNTDQKSFIDESNVTLVNHRFQGSARVRMYRKRKYSDAFYSNTNKKIAELEQNDHGLRKRLNEILKIDENDDINTSTKDNNTSVIDLLSFPDESQTNKAIDNTDEIEKECPNGSSTHKSTSDVITTQFTSVPDYQLNLKLKAWLEPSLKMYKQRFGKGFFKKSLDPPKTGKIALYPWDFIIGRYHEKKNLFLVTNQKPFRIFMAVDSRNSFLEKCVNISSIEDLDAYPISIKNIVTCQVSTLKDQLCILCGLSFCWELVGSVKKLHDRKNSDSENLPKELSSDSETRAPQAFHNSNSPTTNANDSSMSNSLNQNDTEESKWFIMTLENDFNEIQFYKKGFFVKYDSIIKAINVARVSEKTVRLSSQKCNDGISDPQFGIYAIPNANEYCVFIGPYEKNESLGIEIVKTPLKDQKMQTKGVWITTKKVDNLRVIDNPLSFMSQVDMGKGQILEDTLKYEAKINSVSCGENASVDVPKENKKVIKLLKPIKIAKTNNFYHLTSSGILKPIIISPEKSTSQTPIVLQKRLSFDLDAANSRLSSQSKPQLNENSTSIEANRKSIIKRPIAEIAPQVKVVDESSEETNMQQKISKKKFEGGMFILKPEEINSRSLVNKIGFTPSSTEKNCNVVSSDMEMDIESFLATSIECRAPNNEVYVISDDEDYCSIEQPNKTDWNDVWIICKNVRNIGWISGRQDANKYLSFEFPGFKFTEFYPEDEAFAKITQVLARKIYVPDNLDLIWYLVNDMEDLKKLKVNKLKTEDLKPDYVLTTKGLIHKSQLFKRSNKRTKGCPKNVTKKKITIASTRNTKEKHMDIDLMKNNIIELEAESHLLVERGQQLLNETMQQKEELSGSFSKMSNDQRQKISERLRTIISNANSL